MAGLFAQGIFTGFRRSLRRQYCHTALIHIENVNNLEQAKFYLNKKCVFVYPESKKVVNGTVVSTHGNSGTIRCKFDHNLSPSVMGKVVRILVE
ncbi:Ribosomal protein L35 [Spironucleus salmonicida]|uniref:Ribosomal protein L35 n=1 Tax=Spironucleus salmonicida TaxID=348837 RepID=V6LLM1_9EUKA|nr:Ribosomal protein L35 [Spironucleus salmonicida]|eukprot:EST45585.1 Ribosomal protein L35a [Spironucleus salmonicida]